MRYVLDRGGRGQGRSLTFSMHVTDEDAVGQFWGECQLRETVRGRRAKNKKEKKEKCGGDRLRRANVPRHAKSPDAEAQFGADARGWKR